MNRLTFQVGDKEISLEGDERFVAERFDALARMLIQESAQAKPDGSGLASGTPRSQFRIDLFETRIRELERETADDEPEELGGEWDKVPLHGLDPLKIDSFFVLQDGLATIGDPADVELSDLLLLSMYGHHYLIGDPQMTAPALVSTVRASGVEITRADRPLNERKGLWRGVGERRGKKYGLTRAGVDHCERIIRQRLIEKRLGSAGFFDPYGPPISPFS